ncbi:hypothetical protein B0H14DRAFT_3485462 [Mycena olivaceomarginata]|nr:hypothetical protein B0H14DRAFT_3485462 [Mycena olivaceomarginata]
MRALRCICAPTAGPPSAFVDATFVYTCFYPITTPLLHFTKRKLVASLAVYFSCPQSAPTGCISLFCMAPYHTLLRLKTSPTGSALSNPAVRSESRPPSLARAPSAPSAPARRSGHTSAPGGGGVFASHSHPQRASRSRRSLSARGWMSTRRSSAPRALY